jgi:endonuclease I
MKFLLNLSFVLLFLTFNLFSQIPVGYYNSTTGLKETQLQQALHDIIDNHIEQDYDELHTHFYKTDVKPNGKVWDMYSDIPNGTPPYEFIFGDDCGNYNSENDCYNREHSWPKSWFDDGSPMFSDLFHLYPTDGYVNGQRGNLPFGEVDGEADWTSMNGSKKGSCTYPGYTGTVFEPIDAYKGDFARTYFYMATRYYKEDSGWPGSGNAIGSQLTPWTLEMMLKWSDEDPVSEKEINRNNEVYKIQNNRNPFIDNPEYINYIWRNTTNVEKISKSNLTIFPNPANNYITVKTQKENNAEIIIYDVFGREVIKKELFSNEEIIDISKLNKGVYFVKTISPNNSFGTKLIVE